MKWAGLANKNCISFLHTEFFQEKMQPFIKMRKNSTLLFGTSGTNILEVENSIEQVCCEGAHDYYMKI
jgi:hypothetical protein